MQKELLINEFLTYSSFETKKVVDEQELSGKGRAGKWKVFQVKVTDLSNYILKVFILTELRNIMKNLYSNKKREARWWELRRGCYYYFYFF